MEVNERIKQRRKELGLNAEQVAERIGVSPATIYRYESGEIRNMKAEKLKPIALALQTTPEWLMGWSDEVRPLPPVPTDAITFAMETEVTFPVIGSIAAGYDRDAVEEFTGEVITIPREMLRGRKKEDFFVLKVKGNSMYPKLEEGDKLLVLRCSSVDPGSIAVVLYNGDEATVKKVYSGDGWLDLIPVNPDYPTRRIEGAELENCRILGRATGLLRDISLF